MQPSVLFIWLGALLIIGGVLLMAGKVLFQGRLSEAGWFRPGMPRDTLEPRGPNPAFSLKAHWPGLVMAGLGVILLVASAAL